MSQCLALKENSSKAFKQFLISSAALETLDTISRVSMHSPQLTMESFASFLEIFSLMAMRTQSSSLKSSSYSPVEVLVTSATTICSDLTTDE